MHLSTRQSTISILYNLIARLLVMLEDELDQLRSSNAIQAKKTITDTLHKLVALIVQLNKMQKDEELLIKTELSNEDNQIIEHFLCKYLQQD